MRLLLLSRCFFFFFYIFVTVCFLLHFLIFDEKAHRKNIVSLFNKIVESKDDGNIFIVIFGSFYILFRFYKKEGCIKNIKAKIEKSKSKMRCSFYSCPCFYSSESTSRQNLSSSSRRSFASPMNLTPDHNLGRLFLYMGSSKRSSISTITPLSPSRRITRPAA